MDHLGSIIIVKTKEELQMAIKQKYGVIHMQGDLYDVIYEDLEKKQTKHAVGGFGIFALSWLSIFVPPAGVLSLLMMAGFTAATVGLFKNLKASKYEPRDDFSTSDMDSEKEIVVVHEKLIKEIQKKYNGVGEATAKTGTELKDMLLMKVNKIHVDDALYHKLIKAKEEAEEFRKKECEKKKKKYTRSEDLYKLTYPGYKEVNSSGKIALVRIR